MGNNVNAPFRADVVGSFLRPAKLKKARDQFNRNEITAEQLKAVEDELIIQLINKEKGVGLQCVTDGEFRRSYWHLDFMWGFTGVEHNVLPQGYLFHGEETRADSARLCGKIRFESHPFIEHFEFAKSVAGGDVIVKQTIPSPSQFYAELVRAENEKQVDLFYLNSEELYTDLIKAYHDFILALYEKGCHTLQLDDCTWGMLCDPKFWTSMTNGAYDMNTLQELYLRLNNGALTDLPADLIVNSHVCRGNYHSTWATSGGYEPVAANLFGKENVNAYYLEFDTERAGGFEPLRLVLGDKKVVLGLITSKFPQLEDKEVIKSRIKEASKYVAFDHLYLSPQCGFSSTEEGNILTEDEQWNKVALVQEIAREVWDE